MGLQQNLQLAPHQIWQCSSLSAFQLEPFCGCAPKTLENREKAKRQTDLLPAPNKHPYILGRMMNIEYAQTIALRVILHKAGIPALEQNTDGQYLYPSPFSEDANLLVNESNNTWKDAHSEMGGGAYELVAALLQQRKEPCTAIDILHWFKFKIGYPPLQDFIEPEPEAENEYKIICKVKLQEGGLIRYAAKRGIPYSIAKELFKQIYVLNKTTGNEFVALGFKNEDGGFMLYNEFVETSYAPAAITFIRGKENKPDSVHIFKDVFAYQAAIRERLNQPFNGDSIILNTWSCLDNAAAYIRGYGYQQLCTWFEDSGKGKQAAQAFSWLCSTEQNMMHHVQQLPLVTT
jgi:hypothetical protein